MINPTVTGTIGRDGWFTSDVAVSWSVTDAESAVSSQTGCDPVTGTTDTTGQSFTCTATSGGGTATTTVPVKRDATPPALVITGGPADGASYSPAQVPPAPTCTATDATSGLATPGCDVGGYETGAGRHTIAFSAIDVAGNTALVTRTYTVNPDTTGPEISPTVTGTLGGGGWYRSDVDVTWTVTDPESAVTAKIGCDPSTVTTDTAGQTFTCTATSGGGPAIGSVTVRRDTAGPALAITGGLADGATYPAGKVPAAPACTATDVTSGPATQACTVTGYSTTPGGHTITFSATDVAGNTTTASRSYTVTADTTAPASAVTPAPGAVPGGQPLVTVTGTMTVKNSSGATVATINTTCWNSSGAVLTLGATDGGSGVASLTYAAAGAGPIPSTTATTLPVKVAVNAAGGTTVTYGATDQAGNVEAVRRQTVFATGSFTCTAPTQSFTVPTHGAVTVTGTANSGGRSIPFTRTVAY